MFTEMERMASVGETSALLRSISNRGLLRPYLLFPEQRTFSVRETAGIPLRWILAASQSDITTPTFSASVERDEFFVFQIGVLSTGAAPVTVLRYDVLRKHPPASVLLNCFSLEGVDFHGRSFNQNMTVPARSVGSLWFGVNVSDSLSPGAVEHFGLQLFFADNSSTVVDVRLTVAEGPPLLVHGDHNATRLSRLRWLDSTRWQDTTVSQSYQPVMVTQQPVTGGAVITLLNRRVEVLSSGLLGSVQSNGAELLAAPMGFSLTATSGKVIQVRSSRLELHQHGEGVVSWSSEWSTSTAELSVQCSGVLYYDGFIDYSIAVTNDAAVMQLLGNSRFEVAFKADAIRWLMGFDVMPSGRWNASRPIDWSWSAYADGAEQWLRNLRSSAWLGKPHAGMRVKFKGLEPEWNSPSGLPLLPPSPWAGCHGKPPATGDPAAYKANCTGRVSVMEQGGVVTLSSSSGPITLAATSSTVFPMDILVTPMRPVNLTRHMETRYAHLFGNVQTKAPAAGNPSGTLGGLVDLIASLNATYAILHQGTSLNTYINEPILEERLPALETFVRLCHAAGIKVKLYFTTRELTNRAPELFAIKSLPNHEVITTGPGGGGAWLQEHLGHDYLVGWSSVNYVSQENGSFFGLDPNLKGVRADEAVQDSGSGRWSNWYVEGVHYSVSEWPGSDGLYCDGIAFDRGTLERVRKSMEAAKGDDVRIDLHASNGGGCDSGGWGSPALQYAQHLSWVDSLWFGEGFDCKNEAICRAACSVEQELKDNVRVVACAFQTGARVRTGGCLRRAEFHSV